jgi:hypothetical protein
MSEIKEDSVYQSQKRIKPKIEDIVQEYLNAKTKKDLIDFLCFLELNKIGVQWASTNSWNINYKSKRVGCIRMRPGFWQFNYGGGGINDNGYENFITTKKQKELVWKNIVYCKSCSGCAPGHHVSIFGKEFDKVCLGKLGFENPDGENLDCAKQIVLWRQSLIAENKVPKVHYIGKAKRDEFIKKYGVSNFQRAFEVFDAYYKKNIPGEMSMQNYGSDTFFKIFSEIEKNIPNIHPLKLLEMGLEKYTKQ